MKRIIKLLILIILIIAIDQLTKFYIQEYFSVHESVFIIDGFFSITYVRNPGAAFGFLANVHDSIRRPLFIFIPILACLWLILLIWQSRKGSLILSLAYSLIFAGAIGNLIDRIRMNYVVDFLDFYYRDVHFPAFNVADMVITIAAFLLILDLILYFIFHKRTIKDKI